MNESIEYRATDAKTGPVRFAAPKTPAGPLRIALEPRILFDGAAIAAVVAHPAAAAAGDAGAGAAPADGAHQTFPQGVTATHEGAAAAAHADPAGAHAPDPSSNAFVSAPAHAGGSDGHSALQDAVAAIAPVDAGAASSASASHTVVFIDAGLAHPEQLVAAVPEGAQIVMIDPAKDGLQQVATALAGRTDIDALHFITHGNAGAFEIGTSVLDTRTITADRNGLLAEIGTHLAVGADVLVYGCDFGAGAEGVAATQALAHALGAHVAASDDATGAASLHGDWVLEQHVGAIHAPAIDAAAWDGLLLGLPIVATADVAVMQINGTINIDVVANDIDLNGSAITLTGAAAAHGTVGINANNTLRYTPNAGFFGVDTVTYTVRDGLGATNAVGLPGLVSVTVNPLTLPTLGLSAEDTPIVFASALGTQLSVGDLNGNLAHLTLSVPTGSLSLATTANVSLSQGTGSNDSTVTIDGPVAAVNAALNGLVYTPPADYNGPVNLTISLPGLLGLSVSVLPINISPVADIVPDTVLAHPGQSVGFNVLANDTFENPGRVVSGHTNPTHGTLTIDAQGRSTYTSVAGYNGVDTFNYTVASNGTTETATVTIIVGSHAPTATPIPTQTVNDAQVVSIPAGAAFSDAEAMRSPSAPPACPRASRSTPPPASSAAGSTATRRPPSPAATTRSW